MWLKYEIYVFFSAQTECEENPGHVSRKSAVQNVNKPAVTQFPKPPIWPPRTVFTEPLTAAPAAGVAYTSSPVSSSAPGDPFPETAATTRVDDEHVLHEFMNSKRNKNTNKKTEQNVKRFREWLAQEPRCEGRDLIDIEPVDMDRYVGGFLLELKKPNNTDYEPDTLTSFHRSINRKLEEIGYGYSLVDSKEFKLSKKVLESRRRDLKQKGLGNRPNVARPLSKNDEEKLWETKQFGSETPSISDEHSVVFQSQTVWFSQCSWEPATYVGGFNFESWWKWGRVHRVQWKGDKNTDGELHSPSCICSQNVHKSQEAIEVSCVRVQTVP